MLGGVTIAEGGVGEQGDFKWYARRIWIMTVSTDRPQFVIMPYIVTGDERRLADFVHTIVLRLSSLLCEYLQQVSFLRYRLTR